MKKYKSRKHTMLNSREEFSIEDYNNYKMEFAEDFGEEFTPIESECEAFWEWVDDMRQMEIEDFWGNLKYSEYNAPCYVRGTLGLWDGTHTIEKKEFSDLVDAIRACFGRCDEAEVLCDGNAVYVNAYHHDGCNSFKIVIKGKKIKGGYLW